MKSVCAKAAVKEVKGSQHEGGIFRRERSIFKTYQEDDEDFCRKMLSADLKYAKIKRFLRRGEDDRVQEIYETHYRKLKNTFMFYGANAKDVQKYYPRLSMAEFSTFCYKNKLFDRNF